MSWCHVEEISKSNKVSVTFHVATPLAINSAGYAISDCLKGAGRATTNMVVDPSVPGQIETNERNAILAGTVIEFGAVIPINDPANLEREIRDYYNDRIGGSNGELQALINNLDFFGTLLDIV